MTIAMVAAMALMPATRAHGRIDAAPATVSLAVVANLTNPIVDLTASELRDLFLGRQTTWPNGRRVTLVLRQGEGPERAALLRLCCRMTPEDYDRHMLHAVFTGELTSAPKSVSSDAAIKKFVFNVPGAIGVVDADGLDNTVRVLRIDGRLPHERGYSLTMP